MKKNYFLSLVVSLLVAVTASAADNLVGIYKLSNLTAEQKDALGTIDAEAAIRILPGDADADYYVSGIAGYGCKFPATYDEAAGTLTAVDQSPYGAMAMVLYFGDTDVVVANMKEDLADDTLPSIIFNVKDNGATLEIADEILITGMFTQEVYGDYIPGITLTKDETPIVNVSDIVGNYIFTGTGIKDFWTSTIEELEYTMSIEQVENNSLIINGFMDVDGIQATYIPEVGMILIDTQDIGEVSIGDIYFTVSDGELELITPATAGPKNDMPYVSISDGKAVKESSDDDTNGIENTIASSAATISVSNGAIYVNSAEPVAVQVFNAAGVQVYSDTVANSAITLPHGVYFVKVAGNAKAVSVAL